MKRTKYPKSVVYRDPLYADGWLTLPNIIIQDKNLSIEAIIVLVFLRSYETTDYIEEVDMEWLIEMTRLSKRTVQKALIEIKNHIFASKFTYICKKLFHQN